MAAKYAVRVSGTTKPRKEFLKRRGFKWNGFEWVQSLEAVFAERLLNIETRDAALRALEYRITGCRVFVDTLSATRPITTEVYCSPSAPLVAQVDGRDSIAYRESIGDVSVDNCYYGD